jgi:hypothetical protein
LVMFDPTSHKTWRQGLENSFVCVAFVFSLVCAFVMFKLQFESPFAYNFLGQALVYTTHRWGRTRHEITGLHPFAIHRLQRSSSPSSIGQVSF